MVTFTPYLYMGVFSGSGFCFQLRSIDRRIGQNVMSRDARYEYHHKDNDPIQRVFQ
jgi:hypothetical protein